MSSSTLLARVLGGALEVFAPDLCSACEAPAGETPGWCDPCLARLPWEGAVCRALRPQHGAEPWLTVHAALRYDDPVPALVGRWKFAPDPPLSRGLGAAFRVAMGPRVQGWDHPLVAHVPQSGAAWRHRGFSPSLDLAVCLARLGRWRRVRALRRTRAAPAQVGLTARQRSRNVRRLFRVRPRAASTVRSRRVVLVDDVVTTGATAGACAHALRAAGASEVVVVALARAEPP